MSSLYAIYIRAADTPTIKAVRSAYPEAKTEPKSQFFSVERSLRETECPEASLLSLSKTLHAEILWLSFQSVVEAFQFFHWSDGTTLRTLIYGCIEERIWERSEGEPEAWETEALFDVCDLADKLECYDDVDERKAIENIYRNHLLTPGNFHPSLNSHKTARAVAKFYRLPGWFLEDNDAPDFHSVEPVE